MLKKIIIVLLVVAVFGAVKIFGLDQYLSFEYVQANLEVFQNYYLENRVLTISIYFIIYVLSTALSIPGATVLTLLGGGLFGLAQGLVIVSFASTLGASIAFLIARYVLRDFIEKKYSQKLSGINKGIEKEGAFYLFTLRLLPVFPFFLINLTMGLTKISLRKFFIVSQIGMLPGTAVYVNAGLQLAQLDSLSGILSFDLIVSFALLGIFPLLSKKFVALLKARKVYKPFKKPKKFDYNMVVIGAGAGGLVTSYISAAVRSKVALIEKEKMGGDCLNTGCIPSKALIKSAKIMHQISKAKDYGIQVESPNVNFQQVMSRIQAVIKKIEPHDSVERYSKLGVECISGTGEIISPWEVKVNGRVLTTKNITIAAGASPFVPSLDGLDKTKILTSNNLWKIQELPKRLTILGGGPIGLEMAQSFQRLGSQVTVVEMGDRIMTKEDADVSDFVTARLRGEGVEILTQHKALSVEAKRVICENNHTEVAVEFDELLVAVGRKANTQGYGLENLDVKLRKNGTIEANDFLQTNYPNIYVCGDITGPFQLTHAAAHQAWYCAVNGLFGAFKKFKTDYSVLPWCTYTDPEVASVGKSESECEAQGLDYEVIKYGIDDLDRAIADGDDYGFVKVMVQKGSDKILGATIVGTNAGELLIEFVSAMKHKKGLNTILSTIHSYPTFAEANKYLAGEWKKKNQPEKVLRFLEKFHRFMRQF